MNTVQVLSTILWVAVGVLLAGGAAYALQRLSNRDAICAAWRRQLGHLLLNPLGYIYILVFTVAVVAFLFIPDAYYKRNIADLGPLTQLMPWFLVALLPALAMGSWALERELGTEEQLLSLPVTVTDVLLGKWLGVVTFFTFALICTGWNVLVIKWRLGSPDLGLTIAQYVGWWLAGLVLAAFSVFASTLVSLPAVAFVLGGLFSLILMGLAWWLNWFDTFNRGLISTGRVVSALVFVCLGLGLAVLSLSARRWQPRRRLVIVAQQVAFVCLAVTLMNFAIQADQWALDRDMTEERLSTLSPAARKALEDVGEPLTVTAFVTKDPPKEILLKTQELVDFLKTVDRQLGNRIDVRIRSVAEPLDPVATEATTHYGLKPQKIETDTITGREWREVFLGVVVQCGARTQKIEYFFPGLSVEYELVRAIRAVASVKKKVLGVVNTDLKIVRGFDYMSRRSREDWEIVEEWRKLYEVREVNLDVPVATDVDVLVIPEPSTLAEDQLKRLHDYIWDGRPALILQDPFPATAPLLGGAKPKKMPPMGMQMGMPPQEGDAGPCMDLLRALGLEMNAEEVYWSGYNPSDRMRSMPRGVVWCDRNQGSILPSPITDGIDSVLLPFPGALRAANGKSNDLTITPLLQPATGSAWGKHNHSDYVDPFIGPQMPEEYRASSGEMPFFAAEVSGRMKRVYHFAKEEKKEDEKKAEEKKAEGPEKKAEPEEKGRGQLGAKPVRVIVIADTDLMQSAFMQFYRGAEGELSKDEYRVLTSLRNIQFLANAVDALAGDETLMKLRARVPKARPLTALEDALAVEQKSLQESTEKLQKEAEAKVKEKREEFKKRIEALKKRTDLDPLARANLVASTQTSAGREVEQEIEEINRKAEVEVRKARSMRDQNYHNVLFWIKVPAFAVPAVALTCLAMGVLVYRRVGERKIVPASRRRSGS